MLNSSANNASTPSHSNGNRACIGILYCSASYSLHSQKNVPGTLILAVWEAKNNWVVGGEQSPTIATQPSCSYWKCNRSWKPLSFRVNSHITDAAGSFWVHPATKECKGLLSCHVNQYLRRRVVWDTVKCAMPPSPVCKQGTSVPRDDTDMHPAPRRCFGRLGKRNIKIYCAT